MKPTTQTAHAHKRRFIRLDLVPFEGNPGIVTITLSRKSAEYLL